MLIEEIWSEKKYDQGNSTVGWALLEIKPATNPCVYTSEWGGIEVYAFPTVTTERPAL